MDVNDMIRVDMYIIEGWLTYVSVVCVTSATTNSVPTQNVELRTVKGKNNENILVNA